MPDATVLTVSDVHRAFASFDWEHWRQELDDRYRAWHTDVLHTQARSTAADLGGEFAADDPYVTKFASRYVAERVTQLEDTTRDELRDLITRTFDAADEAGTGVNQRDLADVLADQFDDFSTTRANTIARTETAIVENQGTAFGYVAAGYNYVAISDGDGDAECAAADGQIWSVEYWLANPIEHPNCERSGAPINDEDALAAGIDQE